MLFRVSLSLLIILFLSGAITGQTDNHDDSCPICKDGVHVDDSPYKKGFKVELPFLATGIGLMSSGIILNATNGTVSFTEFEVNNLDRNNVNPFDRPATYNWDSDLATTSDYLALSALP